MQTQAHLQSSSAPGLETTSIPPPPSGPLPVPPPHGYQTGGALPTRMTSPGPNKYAPMSHGGLGPPALTPASASSGLGPSGLSPSAAMGPTGLNPPSGMGPSGLNPPSSGLGPLPGLPGERPAPQGGSSHPGSDSGGGGSGGKRRDGRRENSRTRHISGGDSRRSTSASRYNSYSSDEEGECWFPPSCPNVASRHREPHAGKVTQ